MNFEDEHYVRLYTRKTKTVKRWGWEGRTVFRELLTVVDKAGILDDIEEAVEDVALMAELPEDVVRVGLPRLLKSGAVEIRGSHLIIPNYIEANTATKSDKLRAKESRDRRAATIRLEELRQEEDVTERDADITERTRCDDPELETQERDDVTEGDGAVTIRDEGLTERSETLPGRPAASLNAVQRSTTQLPPTPSGPIPCPEDLTLAAGQIASLEIAPGIPRWAVDAMTRDLVTGWLSDEDSKKTLPNWRKYLLASIKRQWSDPNKRPRKPEPEQDPETLRIERERRERAENAATRKRLGLPPLDATEAEEGAA